MSEIIELGGASAYDFNKSLIAKENDMSPSATREKKKQIVKFMMNSDNTYFMLLCRERNDYTIFRGNRTLKGNQHNAEVMLYEILPNRGNIKSIDYSDGKYECWVEKDDVAVCYMFFPCDDFVIDEV